MLVVALCVACIAAAQSRFSGTYLYDVHTREAIPVVTADIGAIREPFGLKYDITVSTIAGIYQEKPIAGIWLNGSSAFAKNAWVKFGPALSYENNRLGTRGLVFGISVTF